MYVSVYVRKDVSCVGEKNVSLIEIVIKHYRAQLKSEALPTQVRVFTVRC